MANETIRARIEVLVRGMDQVESLKNAARQLQGTAAPAAADLQKLKNAALQLGDASDRTENDLRRSINALKDVRAQLSLADADYRKLTGTINKYQSQLDRATGSQQKAGRGMQFAQTAGAVAASGVFGGPEGLVGAGIGAFFGPGGALAGGAIGAQVGMVRQQLGATTTLAADLQKQRIALKLVLKDTSEYNSALEFLSKTSRDYAIPQDRLLKGFTQLAASVAGAGGNINDTKIAFEGITAGIRGTGGSLENLDGALLATAQVFSKGKVSAEELRGQIGERLPGAFTLFAEAIGKTPQELDKALERGEVSLQDFLKFSGTLFGEYGENAKIIADSPAAAGDRLQTNLKNLGESVGTLLQPIGASFQNTFSDIVKYIDIAARKLADFLGMNKSNTQKIGELNNQIIIQQRAVQREKDKLASGVTSKEAAAYSIKEFEARIARLQAEARTLKAFENAASEQQKDTRKGLAGASDDTSAADAKAAEKARKDAERLAAEQQRLDEATAKAEIDLQNAVFRNQMDLLRRRFDYEEERIRQQRDIWAGTFEGVRGEAARSFVDLQNRLGDLRKRLLESDFGVRQAEQDLGSARRMEAVTSQGVGGGIATTGIVARTGNTGQSTGAHLDLRWGDGRPITRADADKYFLVNGKAPSSFGVTSPYGPRSLFGRNFHSGIDFGTPAGSGISLKGGATFGRNLGNTGAGGYAIEVMTPEGTMRALHLMAGSAMRTTGGAAGTAAQTRRDVRAEGNLGAASAGLNQARAMSGLDMAQVQGLERMLPQQFAQQQTQKLRDQAKALEDTNALLTKRMELEAQGVRPELLDAQMKIAEIELQRSDKLAQLNENLRLATEQQDPTLIESVRAEIELTNGAYERQIVAITTLSQMQTAQGAALNAYVGQLRQQLNEMTNIENVVISMAQTIESELSSAMSNAIGLLASGTGSVKQVFADMFKSIGASFVQMATQMIAKALIMKVLGILGGAFGGGGGNFSSAFGGGGPTFNPGAFSMPSLMATGGVMSSNGVVPLKRYAAGGVAKSPQMAIYGERGPEAFVPLPDGRSIPVKLEQRSQALSRYQPVLGSSEAAATNSDAANGGSGGAAGGGMIDVRYTVERINNVEYVTADQFQQGLRRAAAEGAARGEQGTLRRLQTSASTRKRIGV